MHGSKSGTLPGCTLLDDSDIVSSVFEERGGHRIEDLLMSLHGHWIIHDAWPTIIESLLTLILRL